MAKATVSVKGGGRITGWLNRVKNALGKEPVVRVGYIDGATYPSGIMVAQVMAYQEFGTPNARFPIPPRPTFRPVIEAGKGVWPKQTASALKQNNYSGTQTMRTMGEIIAGELRQSVADLTQPALSDVTVMMRSMKRKNPSKPQNLSTVYEAIGKVKAGEQPKSGTSVKPLIASGLARQHISYEVSTGGFASPGAMEVKHK